MLSIADAVVSLGNGVASYSNALSMLGATSQQKLFEFAEAIFAGNTASAFEIIDSAVKGGINISVFAKDLTVHFRNLLVVKASKKANEILSLPSETIEKLVSQAEKVSEEQLMFLMKNFSEIESELKFALSPRTLVEVATVKAIMGEDGSKKN